MQKTLKKGFSERVSETKTQTKLEEVPIRIMFQDEARIGRISNIRSCWAQKPIRPHVGNQLIREYVYMYGAVSPLDGRHDSLILPYANTDCMEIFLQEVSVRYPNEHVLMFMDQASWHKGIKLSVPPNIELAYLPPYSPELNPQEHIWDEIKEKYFVNRVFKSLEAVIMQAELALNAIERNADMIKNLTCFSWIKKLF